MNRQLLFPLFFLYKIKDISMVSISYSSFSLCSNMWGHIRIAFQTGFGENNIKFITFTWIALKVTNLRKKSKSIFRTRMKG